MVPSVTGSVPRPVRATTASESPKPDTTIAACSTVRAENAMPGLHGAGSGIDGPNGHAEHDREYRRTGQRSEARDSMATAATAVARSIPAAAR